MLLKKQLQDLSGSVRIYFLIMEIRHVIENLAMLISSFLSERMFRPERMFSLLVDSPFPEKNIDSRGKALLCYFKTCVMNLPKQCPKNDPYNYKKIA